MPRASTWAATFDAVRRAIANAGLHFRVEETVHLAILQFAKFPLWKDLDDSWKALSGNSLVTHLINSPDRPYTDPAVSSAEVDLDQLGDEVPVPADSSQLHAIAEAAAGRTFVLEGPPGTGKSQTITNLLAHAMAAGRRVLFVAEKRAALDVVKKRLEAVGIGRALPGSARQVVPSGGGPRADPHRLGPPRQRRHRFTAHTNRGGRVQPQRPRPIRATPARRERRRHVVVFGAHIRTCRRPGRCSD